MKITDWNRWVAFAEGKKKEISIAQIAEVNKINNKMSKGKFYKMIRSL